MAGVKSQTKLITTYIYMHSSLFRRGVASQEDGADITAPAKPRRPKVGLGSKYVALVPATDEYVASLHTLFGPPPIKALRLNSAVPPEQASAAQADVPPSGLPPKRGRGRCVARDLVRL